jgi:NAD(P)-dependent dehydrogenase (short-subunit alcohol dehydrogenase family)
LEAVEAQEKLSQLMSNSKLRFIVITGVTRGLGRAMTEEFARQGHTVAGCGRSQREIDQLIQTLGKPHDFQRLDVTDDAGVAAWAHRLLKAFGSPDLLINNAAVINRNAPLWKVPAKDFSNVIDVNIKGVANVIRHVVPAMIARKHGVVVNFSSGWGRSTDAEVAPYCATKWGIEGLTQALAQEIPNGMAAVPLNPGVIDTDMLRSCFGDSAHSYPGPDEWAERAVPFLLNLSARHNGQQLTVP